MNMQVYEYATSLNKFIPTIINKQFIFPMVNLAEIDPFPIIRFYLYHMILARHSSN